MGLASPLLGWKHLKFAALLWRYVEGKCSPEAGGVLHPLLSWLG